MRQQSSNTQAELKQQRRELPDAPGVYLLYDKDNKVIYVGKAKSIRKRINSHYSKPSSRASVQMLQSVAKIEHVVVETEQEALLTEQVFIRQHRPKFNIKLRDDKSYPYIAISTDETYPRVYFTREKQRKGRSYYGPYSNAKKVRETLDLLNKTFMLRSCQGTHPGRKTGSPCLDYYIKRCQAPCIGEITKQQYQTNIETVKQFLSGNYNTIQQQLTAQMQEAANSQEYEQAAIYRNRIEAVNSLLERQRVTGIGKVSFDAVAVATEENEANAQLFQIRDGSLIDRHSLYLGNEGHATPSQVVEQFITQYYSAAASIPNLIITQTEIENVEPLQQLLKQRSQKPVEIRSNVRGERRRILELAQRNAKLAVSQERLKTQRRHQQRVEALTELQEILKLPAPPLRIECFDISNLGASHTTASMVVLENGTPANSMYRRFNIQRQDGPDDFTSMAEVLERRVKNWLRQQELSPHDKQYDTSFATLPGLLVIDGGKGQLSSGMKSLETFTQQGVTVISLAKRIEEIFLPDRPQPILIPHDRPALQLLQRVRDEAHRFAITHHRNRRQQNQNSSILDGVAGVGKARKAALIRHFGSPEAVLNASRQELEAAPGIPGKLARELYTQLHRTGS